MLKFDIQKLLITEDVLTDTPLCRSLLKLCAARDFEDVIRLYMSVYRELKSQSIRGYMQDLLLYGGSGVPSEHDVRCLRSAAVPARELKNFLSERFLDTGEGSAHAGERDFILALPEYETGVFPNTEYFVSAFKEGRAGKFARYRSYIYTQGRITPAKEAVTSAWGELRSDHYDYQRYILKNNTQRLIDGKICQNALLYGDRGTGKSTTVKALLSVFDTLRLIELHKRDLSGITDIFEQLRHQPQKFIVFIDDLSFDEGDDNFNLLKQALEGGVTSVPENTAVYATTNRRHVVREKRMGESGGNIAEIVSRENPDAVDENASLTERFGLFLTFSLLNRDEYIALVHEFFIKYGLTFDERAETAAEAFVLRKGKRTPRTAKQFAQMYE